MRLLPSLVTVRKIVSTSDRSQFESDKIEYLAQQILNAEGVISPLVLRRTGIDSYEVIDGDLVYHAAVRAREIDARNGESIAAYIIESDDIATDSILKQIELIRQSQPSQTHEKTIGETTSPPVNSSNDFLSSFERSINIQLASVNSNLKNIDAKLDQNLSTYPPTNKDNDQIETLVKVIADLDKRIPPLPNPRPESQLLKELNEQSREELTAKFTKAGWKGKSLKTMVDSIIETRPYNSFADLTSRKLNSSKNKFFTDATLVKVLDRY